MSLPASGDTRNTKMVYRVDGDPENVVNVLNNSGATIEQGDFKVLFPFGGVALGKSVNGARVDLDVSRFGVMETNELQSGENTFGTERQAVYFDPVTKKFSDTTDSTYYLVGYLKTPKTSAGVIQFYNLGLVEVAAEPAT